MSISVGDAAEHEFSIDANAMAAFVALSNDRSAIHTDEEYARSRGFQGLIVYGGLMLAQLSHVLGRRIPGSCGVSTRWQIDYRRPLYVGERAVLRLEVSNVSAATGLVDSKFTIKSGDRLVATGTAQSLVPLSEISLHDDAD
jgi:acyl dehydratase